MQRCTPPVDSRGHSKSAVGCSPIQESSGFIGRLPPVCRCLKPILGCTEQQKSKRSRNVSFQLEWSTRFSILCSFPDRSPQQTGAPIKNQTIGLWTFVSHENVELTNNFMERLLRRGVLWRGVWSFGCNNVAGCRFVERILTVVQASRLHGRSSLEYVRAAVEARRSGQACPALLGSA